MRNDHAERRGRVPRLNLKRPVFILCSGTFLIFALYKFFIIHGSMFHQDFVAFWSAADLTLAGRWTEIYDPATMFRAEMAAEPRMADGIVFPYPPTFLMFNAPLALTTLPNAYWWLMGISLIAFAAVFRSITRGYGGLYWLGLLAFPPLWENLYNGHYALLTASMASGAILMLARSPLISGILMGLLFVIKPHLAVLFPVGLFAIRAWRPMVVASLTVVFVTACSVQWFGMELMQQFLQTLDPANIQHFVSHVQINFWTPTVFSLLMCVGAPTWLAYLAHFLVALVAIAAVYYCWRQVSDVRLRGAALMTATLLISPHIGLYDLLWWSVPLTWISLTLQSRTAPPYEQWWLAGTWYLVLLLFAAGNLIGFYWLSLLTVSLLGLSVRLAITMRSREM